MKLSPFGIQDSLLHRPGYITFSSRERLICKLSSVIIFVCCESKHTGVYTLNGFATIWIISVLKEWFCFYHNLKTLKWGKKMEILSNSKTQNKSKINSMKSFLCSAEHSQCWINLSWTGGLCGKEEIIAATKANITFHFGINRNTQYRTKLPAVRQSGN